jgi:hypothetical protein
MAFCFVILGCCFCTIQIITLCPYFFQISRSRQFSPKSIFSPIDNYFLHPAERVLYGPTYPKHCSDCRLALLNGWKAPKTKMQKPTISQKKISKVVFLPFSKSLQGRQQHAFQRQLQRHACKGSCSNMQGQQQLQHATAAAALMQQQQQQHAFNSRSSSMHWHRSSNCNTSMKSQQQKQHATGFAFALSCCCCCSQLQSRAAALACCNCMLVLVLPLHAGAKTPTCWCCQGTQLQYNCSSYHMQLQQQQCTSAAAEVV